MAKIWRFSHLDAFDKEEERVFFTFGIFLRKDAFIASIPDCDDFDGHSMVSKMVIKIFL